MTLCLLTAFLFLSLYKQVIDDKRTKQLNDENNFLKMAQLSIGPNFLVDLNFKDSIFAENWHLAVNQIDTLIQRYMDKEKQNLPDSLLPRALASIQDYYYHGEQVCWTYIMKDFSGENLPYADWPEFESHFSGPLVALKIWAPVEGAYCDPDWIAFGYPCRIVFTQGRPARFAGRGFFTCPRLWASSRDTK
jgi:hypothetical protein